MAKIKVWISEPGQKPRHVWISKSLSNLQNTVGGYIEYLALELGYGVICNEEGLLNDSKFNCEINKNMLFGTLIFVGLDERGDFVSCPLELEEMKLKYPVLWRE